MASNRARQVFGNVVSNSHRTNSPLPMIVLGMALVAFWVLATMLQIQTSEAFILNGPAVNFNPDWAVLTQPILLAQGHLSPDMAKAVLWGWGIELMFLIFIVGFEVAHDSVQASSQRLAGWFRTGSIVLIAFDGWTDFQYGQIASGFWGQLAFALITAFVVMFFGIIGLRLIETGLTGWSR